MMFCSGNSEREANDAAHCDNDVLTYHHKGKWPPLIYEDSVVDQVQFRYRDAGKLCQPMLVSETSAGRTGTAVSQLGPSLDSET